ncbi:hypothetical protein J5N97_020455 [Dioscorea zingiberensis]|uniref:Uncharacterized protein n=1 Tax=Dioscorea zingiberensis TaxID=325984 RepID=A0A9D5HD91_9LILI|nr:hypothetical protein J5N97_020455 [Dioscorea zingiberensis]
MGVVDTSTMRKQEGSDVSGKEQDLEVLKAVAQAWHAQAGIPGATKEFEAQKSSFRHRPTRFRMEAMSMAAKEAESNWDFAQSLWDSYEIVTLSKKLEAGLSIDDPVVALSESGRGSKRRRESSNSLRSFFRRISSKRFDDNVFINEHD